MKRVMLLVVLVLAACNPILPGTMPSTAPEVNVRATETPPTIGVITSTSLPGRTPTPSNLATSTPRPTRTPFFTNTTLPTSVVALRQAAIGKGIDIGAAVAVESLLEEEMYRQVLVREFNLLTAENAMKFIAVEPQQGVYDFKDGDHLVDFAQQNGMRVRGHTFIWHQALPEWLEKGTFTREELIKILQDHIFAEAGHFKGKVFAWDVVNEGLDDTGSLRSTIWLDGIGPDYIEIAFRTAREADPDALLFYNDFNAEGMNEKSDAVYALVKDLKEKGLIDGVGLQMHVTPDQGLTQAELEENMRRLGELGLIVHITELDVRLATPPTQVQLEDQAMVYWRVFDSCLAVPACKAVVMWGFTDRHSWVPEAYRNFGAALPFDENYLPKPAYHAISEALYE
jgi:endo-1,4-beta-xylanase